MPEPVNEERLRFFQASLQDFCDEHSLGPQELIYYLRKFRVDKGRISTWLPSQPGRAAKRSKPRAPTLRNLGYLLGRLLPPEKTISEPHKVTPKQACQLLSAFFTLHECPENIVALVAGHSEELARHKKESNWHHRLVDLNQEMAKTLLAALLQVDIARRADYIRRFITSSALPELLRFFGCLYGEGAVNGQRAFRAVIYTPRKNDPTELGIRWAEGFDRAESWEYNRYYCGDTNTTLDDPELVMRGGLAGLVFVTGEGDIFNNALTHERYLNVYGARRNLPEGATFNHALLTVIRCHDHDRKMGVLGVDSLQYEFTKDEVDLVNHLSKMIGWLLDETGVSYLAD